MKSKNAKNRKKNRRVKRNAPNKAQDLAADIMEQRTLDSLDPVKNAPDASLFVFDNNLPHKNKLIKNKTTTTDKKLAAGQLGIRLPKNTTGKTLKEKRKLSESEKEVIERKAKRLRGDDDKEQTEKKEKKDQEGDDVMEDEKPEQKPIVLEKPSKKAKKSDTPAKPIYDLWGDKPAVPVKPNESFIQEVLYPKQKEFVPKPIESKLSAVPVEAGHSYRPVPEDQERLQKQRKKMEDKLYAEGKEGAKLMRKLGKYNNKTFFPRIDTGDDEKANGEEVEEGERIRMIPQKHKTERDLKKIHQKKVARDARERAEEFARREQKVDNIPEFLADIEAKEKKREEKRLRRAGLISDQVNKPRSTDGKKVKQPVVVVTDKSTDRLHSLQAIVNPLKDRFLSMKNRGLISTYKHQKAPLPQYKTVERPDVRVMMREDEEKYLKPVLDKLEKAQKQSE